MPVFGMQPPDLLQTVLDCVGAAIAIVDDRGTLVFLSQTALEMFGETRGLDQMPYQDWFKEFRFEDALGNELTVEQSLVMRVLAGEQVEPHHIRVRFSDGRIKWLHTWARAFEVMRMKGVLVIGTDETTEMNLRQATAQAERVEAAGALAAGLAHDFNNVLQTIALNAEAALLDPQLGRATRDKLQQISKASNSAATLAARLMRFSRRQDSSFQTIQINQVVADTLKLISPLVPSNIRVQTDLRSPLPYVQADHSQLEQMLVNLVLNALDAMPGGGEVKISTRVADDAGKSDQSEFVIVSVSDTGLGIPHDLQTTIFEPLFTTKASGKGTGLGLSSVLGIVKRHNGKIKLKSAPGKGADFSIYLPVPQPAVSSNLVITP